MKKIKHLTLLSSMLIVASLFLVACNNVEKEDEKVTATEKSETGMNESMSATATLSGTMQDTSLNGTVEFMTQNGKVNMSLMISVPKMANKSVAVHLHEMGDCGDMGKMAHGHWNPTNQQHGKWGSGSFHSGDIGNISLNADGNGSMQLETDLWTIGGDEKTNILNRSVIVHGGVDDFTTQPTGNAGSRIGCGVITKK